MGVLTYLLYKEEVSMNVEEVVDAILKIVKEKTGLERKTCH